MNRSLRTAAIASALAILCSAAGCGDDGEASAAHDAAAGGRSSAPDASQGERDGAVPGRDGGITLPPGDPCSNDACTKANGDSAAVCQGPVTGRAIADAMSKLVPPGPMIEVGPGEDSSNVQRALSLLAEGESIDLQGVSGNLDFDLDTGEPSARATPIQIWCIGSKGGQLQYLDAGQSYDAMSDTLQGTFSCPVEDESANEADAGTGP